MKTVVTLIALGTNLVFASAEEFGHERGAEEASLAKPTDHRRLDSILALVERDLNAVNADRVVSNRTAPEDLARIYRQQAENDNQEAQFKLGAMYLEGLGIRANYGKAAQWFTKVGGADHPLVHLANGRFYLKCRDDDAKGDRTRDQVIRALGRIGPAAAPAIPLLEQEMLREVFSSYTAAVALGNIGKLAVPVLIRGLSSPNARIRRRAAEGLQHAGTAAQDAIPALTEALKDEDSTVRRYAEAALKRLHSAKEDG